ncbi:PPOX class F420-dependent oxidoreductase [Actinomadura logoneensis]|uniref:PPOX class F420-dependent oxidoreductase n=1 Tax=Actinomadura logoneensis TaxID=2293572 RepID=A0A372JRG8_9ACTN|nr:PPOX class F420-dependent oxidoreductase [Actinomadura logoneensis]RFU42550.1 PPOX class F420-dependent oxidoreductase [Actinomadura logoneensis]
MAEKALNDKARELFDGKNFVTVATLNADGAPQASPVWAKVDGDTIVFSTVKGRRKHSNLVRDPRVNLTTYDLSNPYEYVEVRGTATIEDDPDAALIEELSQKYTGGPWRAQGPEERVIVRVTPSYVHTR